ncbi:hypothetical protein C8F04DRAFT_1341761 [Mycena alexandri]|uniref:Uncharacterized protein n=1 Tax=Mycena alexandri TaxID=1745969 RepID=A0AAD6T1T5_9AGAR|nr:hypothetical protein C8F04DRAFT_1341761 [Mycena alexandri]
MATPAPFDLQQVAKLFNDTIAIIRDDRPDVEPQASAWLKSARYKLMRDLEKRYYELDRSRAQPLLRPDWALDPRKELLLWTENLPAVLDSYKEPIRENLRTLFRDCGFHHCRITCDRQFYIQIAFPAQLTAGSPAPSSSPLHVEDAFSRFGVDGEGRASAFSGTSFAQLLLETRGSVVNGAATATATSPTTASGNAPTSEVPGRSPAPDTPQQSQSGPATAAANAGEGSTPMLSKKQKKNKRREESRKSKGGIPLEGPSAPAATTPATPVLPDAQTTTVQHQTSTATKEAQTSEGLEEERGNQDVDAVEQEKDSDGGESGVNEGLQKNHDEGQEVESGSSGNSRAEDGLEHSSATIPAGAAMFAATNVAVWGILVALIGAWWGIFLEVRDLRRDMATLISGPGGVVGF